MSTPCTTPTPFETLVALWAGDLTPEAADAVEAHVFACDTCAQACEGVGRLVTGLRELIPPVISHQHRDRLAERGLRLRHTPVEAGRDTDADFTTDVDLLVHVLKADLARAERVDVEVLDESKQVAHFQFQHVPFDRALGEVLIACQRHFEHMTTPPGDPVFRVFAVEAGKRRLLGDYFVRHDWHPT